ncbi:MAG: hypothetical protein ACP5OA_02345 [Candidatus Woesearchaeota archaeon]
MVGKTDFNIDLFGDSEKKHKKREDDLAAGLNYMNVLNDYKMAQMSGDDFTKSQARDKLIHMHDYDTQQKYRELCLESSALKAAGNDDIAKMVRYNAEKLLTSTPKKKKSDSF